MASALTANFVELCNVRSKFSNASHMLAIRSSIEDMFSDTVAINCECVLVHDIYLYTVLCFHRGWALQPMLR